LRQKFINKKEALIHGDLHSGSVMVGETDLSSIKIIDSEFSFYGPIAYDTGNVLAHLIISFVTHENNSNYQNYLKQEITTFYNLFEVNFVNLWRSNDENNDSKMGKTFFKGFFKEFPGLNQSISEKIYKSNMKEIFQETLGFTGTEIIRRIIGVAHVKDFDIIEDLEIRSRLEIKALQFGREIITNSFKYQTIEQILDLLK
jgi:5-methylthioribose kinase